MFVGALLKLSTNAAPAKNNEVMPIFEESQNGENWVFGDELLFSAGVTCVDTERKVDMKPLQVGNSRMRLSQ